MKILFSIVAASLIAAAAAYPQFEGTVRMRAVTYGDGDSNVVGSTVYFKGTLFAAVIDPTTETAGQGGKFILRGDKKLMWIVVDEEKKYMEIPLDKAHTGDTTGHAGMKKTYTLSKTGKSRSIAGYPCDEWVADEGEGGGARIWATAGLGDMYEGVVKWFDEMSMESATDRSRWERELADKKLFPLLVVRTEEGEVTETEEVVGIEKKSIPASMFEPPAGYEKQVVDLNFEKMFEEMMKQMDNGGTDSAGTKDDGGGH
jgi:hypothetical protein